MPPADLGRILFGSVLRVVDEKVGATEEFGVSQILPSDFPVAGCRAARVGLVVTGIHHRYYVGLQPITERERWMIQIVGGDFDIVDIEGALDEVVIANLGSALIGNRYTASARPGFHAMIGRGPWGRICPIRCRAQKA